MEILDGKKHEVRKNKKGIIGLIFILAGLLIIGDHFNLLSFGFRDVIFTWQGLLIGLGLIFLTKHEGRLTGMILILIGGFFLLPKFTVLPVSTIKLFWPTLLVFLGILILFKGGFSRGMGISASNIAGDNIDDVNIFGGNDRIITTENFKGGDIVNVFGGGKYDLLQSKLAPGKNVLEVVMIFGGSKIIVPLDWDVKVVVVAVFGGFYYKRIIPAEGVKDPSRTLVIEGIAIFGGGDLVSFDS